MIPLRLDDVLTTNGPSLSRGPWPLVRWHGTAVPRCSLYIRSSPWLCC